MLAVSKDFVQAYDIDRSAELDSDSNETELGQDPTSEIDITDRLEKLIESLDVNDVNEGEIERDGDRY